ncbi:MAG: hypothetical protein OXK80_00305 [Bdellovibrionales bacterium]|nr:hypothetical protein [Bdellovibrionales bacterium]
MSRQQEMFASFPSSQNTANTTRRKPASSTKPSSRNKPRTTHHSKVTQDNLFEESKEQFSIPAKKDPAQNDSKSKPSPSTKETTPAPPTEQTSMSEQSTSKPKTRRLTKKVKEQIKKDFLTAFNNDDFLTISELIREYPFLKDVRFDHSDLPDNTISTEDQREWMQWTPLGWSPLQLAVYTKNISQLEFFLKRKFNPRTQKRIAEHNPLHIAIKQDFREGVRMILKYVGYIPMHFAINENGRTEISVNKNRFIDEKNNDKQTPWILAIQQDMKIRRTRYTALIGRFRPSGYVQSVVNGKLVDGYEYAEQADAKLSPDRRHMKEMANKYLVAPNYDQYKQYRTPETDSEYNWQRTHSTTVPSK